MYMTYFAIVYLSTSSIGIRENTIMERIDLVFLLKNFLDWKYTLLIMEDIVFKVVRVSSQKARIINIVENPIVSEVVVVS